MDADDELSLFERLRDFLRAVWTPGGVLAFAVLAAVLTAIGLSIFKP